MDKESDFGGTDHGQANLARATLIMAVYDV